MATLPLEYGLIAEEVAEIFPDLVVYDEEGQPFTVKYHLLSSMLLNEGAAAAAHHRRTDPAPGRTGKTPDDPATLTCPGWGMTAVMLLGQRMPGIVPCPGRGYHHRVTT